MGSSSSRSSFETTGHSSSSSRGPPQNPEDARREQERQDEQLARRLMMEEMASLSLAGPQQIPEAPSPMMLRALCPSCGCANTFSPPEMCEARLRCSSCEFQFQAAMPRELLQRNQPRARPGLQLCRNCGTLNSFPAAVPGQAQQVSCGRCGHVSEVESRELRHGNGLRNNQAAGLLAALLADPRLLSDQRNLHDGPVDADFQHRWSVSRSMVSVKQFLWPCWQPSWQELKLISQILPEVVILRTFRREGWKTQTTWGNRQSA